MVASKGGPKLVPFHDAELRRGWRLLRTAIAITAHPARRVLEGTSTLTVAALNVECTSVDLNVRRGVVVRSVRMRGEVVPFSVTDVTGGEAGIDNVVHESRRTRVEELLEAQEGRLRAKADEGEMRVCLDGKFSADVIEALEAVVGEKGMPVPLRPAVTCVEMLPTWDVVVEWEVVEGCGAVAFGVDGEDALVVDGRVGRARCWMPCVDTVNWCDRCPWDITVSVPLEAVAICSGKLEETLLVMGPQDEPHGDHVNRSGNRRVVAGETGSSGGSTAGGVSAESCEPGKHASSGSIGLRERRLRVMGNGAGAVEIGRLSVSGCGGSYGRVTPEVKPLEPMYPAKRFVYSLQEGTSAGEIAMAVGPFLPLADPTSPTSVTHFCLPGKARDLVHTVPGVFAKARAFCADYFNADITAYRSINQVFVGDSASLGGPTRPHCAAGGLILYPSSLLHNARCIDEGFDARAAICNGVVSSYVGSMIRPRQAEDAWFVAGLASHISARAASSIFGKNWYLVHINDEVRAMAEESGPDSPILQDVGADPMFSIEMATTSVRRRAHLIVYIVERRIGGDVLRRALREVVASFPLAASGDNLPEDALLGLEVRAFLKRVRAICGTDVRTLVRTWGGARGMPRMRFGYRYTARRHQTEFAIEQKATGHLETLSRAREGLLFQGPLCVRVMEPEGSFDHTVEVIDPVFVSELSCHCRRTKQKPATQAEKDAGEEPSRIAPISWVRVDPDMEWCIDVTFVQPEEAWIVMLHGERDVIAQLNACRALAEFETVTAAKALAESLVNTELYWRVRAQAAEALSSCEGGLGVLLEYFRAVYCVNAREGVQNRAVLTDCAESSSGKRVIVFKMSDSVFDGSENGTMENLAANDFSDFGEYMLRRAVVKAVASSRNRKNKAVVPRAVGDFLLSLLSDDDNSHNTYDEDHFLADLIRCSAEVTVAYGSDEPDLASALLKQLERHRLLDSMTPSRSRLVGASIVAGIADVEIAKMRRASFKGFGSSAVVSNSAVDKMLRCGLEPNGEIVRSIMQLFTPPTKSVSVQSAFISLARLYGGDLETLQWILSRADRASSGDDIVAILSNPSKETEGAIMQSVSVRLAALDSILEATSAVAWSNSSPILMALRRHTTRARQVYHRIFRLAIGDSDERVRSKAVNIAVKVWGLGVPVCLLEDHEYNREMSVAKQRVKARAANLKSEANARKGRGLNDSKFSGSATGSDGLLGRSGSHISSKKRKSSSTRSDGGGGSGSKIQKLSAPLPKPPTPVAAFRSSPAKVPAPIYHPPVNPLPRPTVDRKVPIPSPATGPRDSKLNMRDEDRAYLRLAWDEHQKAQRASGLRPGRDCESAPAFSSAPAPSSTPARPPPHVVSPEHAASSGAPTAAAPEKSSAPRFVSKPQILPRPRFASKPLKASPSNSVTVPPSKPVSKSNADGKDSKPRDLKLHDDTPRSTPGGHSGSQAAASHIGSNGKVDGVSRVTGQGVDRDRDRDEERRRKKKHKKRIRSGEEGGEGAERKKKKKKRKKKEDGHSSSAGVVGGAGSSGVIHSSGSAPAPSEGSVRSEGRRPTIKIKIAGANFSNG